MSASWYALFYQAAILLKIFSPALHFLCAVQGAKFGMAKVPLWSTRIEEAMGKILTSKELPAAEY